MAEAADHFRRALALRPDDEDVKAYLARATKALHPEATPPR
jgi:uncharacterized protein HemY